MKYALQIGSKVVDLINPMANQIDLEGIEAALDKMLRFTSNPKALSVRQHQLLTGELARMGRQTPEVVEWCEHHDDHEGVIGDITGPLKALLAWETNILALLENKLDAAICTARGITYPTDGTRASVHYYDQLAATLEWRFALGLPGEPWNRAFPHWLKEDYADKLVQIHLGL